MRFPSVNFLGTICNFKIQYSSALYLTETYNLRGVPLVSEEVMLSNYIVTAIQLKAADIYLKAHGKDREDERKRE